jgi:hypothetical protein
MGRGEGVHAFFTVVNKEPEVAGVLQLQPGCTLGCCSFNPGAHWGAAASTQVESAWFRCLKLTYDEQLWGGAGWLNPG